MHFNILQLLKDYDLSLKISVKEVLFELLKIYVIADSAGRALAKKLRNPRGLIMCVGEVIPLKFCGLKINIFILRSGKV